MTLPVSDDLGSGIRHWQETTVLFWDATLGC